MFKTVLLLCTKLREKTAWSKTIKEHSEGESFTTIFCLFFLYKAVPLLDSNQKTFHCKQHYLDYLIKCIFQVRNYCCGHLWHGFQFIFAFPAKICISSTINAPQHCTVWSHQQASDMVKVGHLTFKYFFVVGKIGRVFLNWLVSLHGRSF